MVQALDFHGLLGDILGCQASFQSSRHACHAFIVYLYYTVFDLKKLLNNKQPHKVSSKQQDLFILMFFSYEMDSRRNLLCISHFQTKNFLSLVAGREKLIISHLWGVYIQIFSPVGLLSQALLDIEKIALKYNFLPQKYDFLPQNMIFCQMAAVITQYGIDVFVI